MKKLLMILTLITITSSAYCAGFQWTDWLDRDDPGGIGDFENLSAFIITGESCEFPKAIKCKTLAGADYHSTGQIYTCNAVDGGICRNLEQPTGETCLDYKVKFLCPKSFFDEAFN